MATSEPYSVATASAASSMLVSHILLSDFVIKITCLNFDDLSLPIEKDTRNWAETLKKDTLDTSEDTSSKCGLKSVYKDLKFINIVKDCFLPIKVI